MAVARQACSSNIKLKPRIEPSLNIETVSSSPENKIESKGPTLCVWPAMFRRGPLPSITGRMRESPLNLEQWLLLHHVSNTQTPISLIEQRTSDLKGLSSAILPS